MDDYKVGEFGLAVFIAKRGWKAETTCYGRIMAIEKHYVEFKDNDENIYIIHKNKFKFEKKTFIDLTK